jgi:hypothetical protein
MEQCLIKYFKISKIPCAKSKKSTYQRIIFFPLAMFDSKWPHWTIKSEKHLKNVNVDRTYLGMCPPVDDTKAEESREAVVLTKHF